MCRLGHDPDQTVVRERPDISLVVEDPFTGTVDCCFEHECQNPILKPRPPRDDTRRPGRSRPGLSASGRKGASGMEVVHERCAGMDVSKRDVKVCVRSPGKRRGSYAKAVTTFGSVTAEILRLREHLITAGVTLVVMEATGDYWKPFFYLLENGPFEVMLVNPAHARNIPGRKTDVSDAQWLAELAAHGLVRGSFVPPPPIRILRDLTRARVILTQDRVREINRLDKVLEDAGTSCPA